MITQIFSQNCIKIITLFSLAPGSRYNRKQIKEKVYMNNIPLDNSLLRLVSSRIFHREKNYYSIDHVNENSKKILDICSKEFKQLKELPLNVYYILMDLSDYFSAAKGVELVLFGSYSKLTYSIKSDIDIAIMGKKADFALAAHIKYELEEETHLPFFFDIIAYQDIDDDALKNHIQQYGKVLYDAFFRT